MPTPLCSLHTTPLVEGKCLHCGPAVASKPKAKPPTKPKVDHLSPEEMTRIAMVNSYISLCLTKKAYAFSSSANNDLVAETLVGLAKKLGYESITKNANSSQAVLPALDELKLWVDRMPDSTTKP